MRPGTSPRASAGRARARAERAAGRARALVPGRPGRRRDARRHGGDERERHDDRSLRRHARARARARGRARRRNGDPHRQPRAVKTSAGYDLTLALRRLRGHARRDHRADAAPARIPEHAGRRPRRLPRRRRRVPLCGGDRSAPASPSRAASCSTRRRSRARQRVQRARRYAEAPSLFVELGGARPASRATSSARELAGWEGRDGVRGRRREPTARTQLWEARHNAAFASPRSRPARRATHGRLRAASRELPAAVEHARARARRARARRGDRATPATATTTSR